MAELAKLILNRKDLTRHLILQVRIPRGFRLRLWLGTALLGLAARVIDVPVEVELIDRRPL